MWDWEIGKISLSSGDSVRVAYLPPFVSVPLKKTSLLGLFPKCRCAACASPPPAQPHICQPRRCRLRRIGQREQQQRGGGAGYAVCAALARCVVAGAARVQEGALLFERWPWLAGDLSPGGGMRAFWRGRATLRILRHKAMPQRGPACWCSIARRITHAATCHAQLPLALRIAPDPGFVRRAAGICCAPRTPAALRLPAPHRRRPICGGGGAA